MDVEGAIVVSPSLPAQGDPPPWGDKVNAFLEVALNADGTLKNGAPLAQSGQTPPQEPVAAGWAAAVGSLAVAKRADAVDPLVFTPILPEVGQYLESGQMQNANVTMTEQQEYAIPISVPVTMTFDRIEFAVSNAGGAGCVVRGGIRAFQPSAVATPGAVLLDAGTAPVTGTGHAACAINQQLAAGIWWVTLTQQGGAATPCHLYTPSLQYIRAPGSTPASGTYYSGPYQSSIVGGLPGAFVTAGFVSGAAPWVALRRSA